MTLDELLPKYKSAMSQLQEIVESDLHPAEKLCILEAVHSLTRGWFGAIATERLHVVAPELKQLGIVLR